MNFSAFKRSLSSRRPDPELSPALAALWWAGKDEWAKSHKIVMDEGDRDSAWVHAYLHRAEGDLDNAGYWYRQSRHEAATGSLDKEWAEIATALLKR